MKKKTTQIAQCNGDSRAAYCSAYQAAWNEQNKQWERLRDWKRKVSPDAKLPKRTHLMDFAAGWSAAIRAVYQSVGKLSG